MHTMHIATLCLVCVCVLSSAPVKTAARNHSGGSSTGLGASTHERRSLETQLVDQYAQAQAQAHKEKNDHEWVQRLSWMCLYALIA
jgi:hypothetical protein